jgi:hypothetical protein
MDTEILTPVQAEEIRKRQAAALAHEQRVKAERARAAFEAEQASLAETAFSRDAQEIRILIDKVQSHGCDIWREGDDILIYPRLATADPAQRQLLVKITASKLQLLPMLPLKAQGPQRI